MSTESELETAVKISSMEQQLDGIGKILNDLRADIKEIAVRNEVITSLQVQSEGTAKTLETLWSRHDEIRDKNQTEHDTFKQFINQSKGSNRVVITLLVVLGAAILTGVGSLFYMLVEAKTINTIQSVEIEKLRDRVDPSKQQPNLWRDMK